MQLVQKRDELLEDLGLVRGRHRGDALVKGVEEGVGGGVDARGGMQGDDAPVGVHTASDDVTRLFEAARP